MNTARPRSTGYRRLPLLFFGMLSLFGGLAAGLARLGWEVPTFAAQAAGLHGPLMIGAFFGTVISLERAVAIGARWAYLAPLAAGSSGLLLLAGGPLGSGQGLASLGALGLIAASVVALRRQMALHTAILTLAAVCWLAGNALWISTGNPAQATPWWLLFLVLTIAGERLELTRMLPTPAHARTIFVAIVTTLTLAAALAADRWLAGGLLAIALWLLRYDIARRNLSSDGLTRYIAVCLFSGYLWLALAGLLGLGGALTSGHPARDPALHALALGFVFAMVFGHAPIIFPAVTRIRIPWHPALYLPLALLHLTLLVRVLGGTLGHWSLRAGGGLLNALALVAFIATVITLVRKGR